MTPTKRRPKENIRLYYQFALDGKPIGRRRRAHSYVKAFSQLLYVQLSYTAQTIRDTGNTNRIIGPDSYNFSSNVAADSDTLGIQVGTSATDETISDYQLNAKIATGNSAGQLRYMAMSFNGPTVVGNTITINIIRPFANNSGGSITVREIGLAVMASGGAYSLLVIHDNLSVEQAVGSGQTLTVTYSIVISV